MKEVKSWSDSPFDRVLSARDVSARGEVLGQNGGESTIVYALATQPEWLVKLYKRPLSPAQASVLDQVIALPDRMGAADRAVVDRSAAWPVARVVDEDTTVGVVMARAPACFTIDLWSPRTGRTRRALLTVDHLVQDDKAMKRQGIPAPGEEIRAAVVIRYLRLGAVLNRHNLVYGDWSYSNGLWEPGQGRVFLIDMDSCGVGRRGWILSNNWDDPHYPRGTDLDVYADRYRIGLLALRCLSGCRDQDRISTSLDRLPKRLRSSEFTRLLDRTLQESEPARRPEVAELLQALEEHWPGLVPGEEGPFPPVLAPEANVTGFRTVGTSRNGTGRRAVKGGPPRGPVGSAPQPTPSVTGFGRTASPTSRKSRRGAVHPAVVVAAVLVALCLALIFLTPLFF